MSKLYKYISLSLLTTVVGFLFGIIFVPVSVILSANIFLAGFLLAILVIALVLKCLKKDSCVPLRFPMGVVYAIAFVEGILLYPVLLFYLQELGVSLFISILAGTMVVFGVLAVIGSKVKDDSFVGFGKTLCIVLSVMIIAFVVNLFVQSDLISALLSAAGILVFSLFIVVDIVQFKKAYNAGYIHDRNDYSIYVLNIYIDIINLLLDILDLVRRLKKR